MLAAMTSPISMVTNSIARIRGVSGSNQLVTQQVYCQPSHTANHRISASTTPKAVRLCGSSWLSWVTAKT